MTAVICAFRVWPADLPRADRRRDRVLCSLLHEVLPVTRGQRYCVLPFLYDEAAARVREANLEHVGDEQLKESLRKTLASRPAAVPGSN
jgi:hypothetical protein